MIDRRSACRGEPTSDWAGAVLEHRVGRPSRERESAKPVMRARYRSSAFADLRARAASAYRDFVA